ncbi:MAG TPA: YicC family protein [Candidatus Omnitrophota bacterium]|nr:YicC family protein [Candidatus Omnitrophota bacterium]
MMISMTGFGQGQAEKKGERFTVTLKSVNHRYFETLFHLPPSLDYLESLFRSKVQKKIKRGRINISIAHINDAAETIALNKELALKYFKVLDGIRRSLGLKDPLSMDSLITIPGILSHKKEELKESEREVLIEKALNDALKKLCEMRRREGQALSYDLKGRIERIDSHMTTIKKLVKKNIEENKKLLAPENLESALRSTDVSEEITRIDFHLKSFLKQMRSVEPKGKVLDFIGQELQREINTLGAKVQDKHVAYHVVMIKDLIEKIRGQVQNVE